MDLLAAIILGIALGITEFLPISSLGHSLVLEALLGFPHTLTDATQIQDARTSLGLFIQGGAVLAVLVYYSRDLLAELQEIPSSPAARQFWINIIIAFVPIGVLGLIFNKQIKQYLFAPGVVAVALIVGGVILLLVEQFKARSAIGTAQTVTSNTKSVEQITPRQALLIGIAQIAALIPGVSRSGATIVGGLLVGLEREVAAKFTFYLFIPTLGAAAGYELFNAFRNHQIDSSLLPYFILATVIGFVVSLGAIRFLLGYISTHDFRAFGVYRIVIGVLILVLIAVKVI